MIVCDAYSVTLQQNGVAPSPKPAASQTSDKHRPTPNGVSALPSSDSRRDGQPASNALATPRAQSINGKSDRPATPSNSSKSAMDRYYVLQVLPISCSESILSEVYLGLKESSALGRTKIASRPRLMAKASPLRGQTLWTWILRLQHPKTIRPIRFHNQTQGLHDSELDLPPALGKLHSLQPLTHEYQPLLQERHPDPVDQHPRLPCSVPGNPLDHLDRGSMTSRPQGTLCHRP